MSSKETLVPSFDLAPAISIGLVHVHVDFPTPIMWPGASPTSIGLGPSVDWVHWIVPAVFVCAADPAASPTETRIARTVLNLICPPLTL
jgi:hypothetical protein